MLSEQLLTDISAVAAALKKNLAAALTGTSEVFSSECQAVVTQYCHGSKPKDSEVYQAALLYLKGRIGEDVEYLYDIVPFGLYLPIESAGNKCIADDHRKLEILLNRYRHEAEQGQLWEMTWFGVLQAYFHPPLRFSEQDILLQFLSETYPKVAAVTVHKPLWMKALAEYPGLLGRDPCRAFAEAWLAGDEESLRQVAADLQISAPSWFWHDLTRTCIKFSSALPDDDFKSLIPKLLSLIEELPRFLDEDLGTILTRYSQCGDRSVHEELKNFAVRHWKNPKLRHVPGSKWMQVREPVWRMALGWFNDEHLRLFFERISARYGNSSERLSSWLRYLSWAKLVAAHEITGQGPKDPVLTGLFRAEEEALEIYDEAHDEKLDSFMRRVEDYLGMA
jgi:hypothetical protein